MTGTPTSVDPRRLLLLSGLGVGIGLAGGGAAWVLLHLIGLLTNAALFHRFGWTVPSFTGLRPGPDLVVVAMGGGLVVSLLARWAPAIRGHGLPEAMEAVLTKQSRVRPRMAVAKPLSAAISIGTGGPFGAEGPIIVTGGAIGSLIGQVIPVSPSERKILLACGSAAGMAATFGTPLAAVVLAIELLLFEYSKRAFVPLVVATSVAGGVHALLFGDGPLFTVPAHHFAGLNELPLFGVLGLGCGLLAVVVAKGLFLVESGYRRLPVGELWHPIIGAAGFALVGLAVPTALGVGYDRIGAVLAGRLAVSTLAVLLVAKLVAWWLALGSGTSGGTLAPILLIGGSFGALVGHAVDGAAPSLGVSPGAFALVAMAAVFGAATRASFTSIVFLFELTGDYRMILPLMLATVVADLVAGALLRDGLMTEKLTRRGVTVQGDYHADVLAGAAVSAIMTREVATLPVDATVADAQNLFSSNGHSAYPLVDPDNRCVGIVGRGDLLGEDCEATTMVRDIASPELVAVTPSTSVLTALHLMLQEGVEHLPVLDGDRLAGICTRTDVLATRNRQLGLERRQRGWRRRMSADGPTSGTPSDMRSGEGQPDEQP